MWPVALRLVHMGLPASLAAQGTLTEGPYRRSRNPMDVTGMAIWAGAAKVMGQVTAVFNRPLEDDMDYEAYRGAYFTDPPPPPRYRFSGSLGVTLFFEAFATAVDYYTRVLGPPAYVEGHGTRGWQIGSGWLTLLQGQSGSPVNVEVTFQMETPAEAERLQQAFIDAGGHGPPPSDALMYEPIRSCPVRDPLGTELLIISPLAFLRRQSPK